MLGHDHGLLSPRDHDSDPNAGYVGSRFAEVWQTVVGDAYHALPEGRLRARDVVRLQRLRDIYHAARRTLSARDDVLPCFNKLVHPIGICLRGRWRITEPSDYSGYFRQGSEALVIARASVNMGETRPGHLRFLGLAGKLYPTTNPDHREPLRTANFVMNENVLGSHTRYFAHATFSTDLLPIQFHTDPRIKIPLGILVASLFALAERAPRRPHPMRRQLYPIAELGEARQARCRAPAVMLLRGEPDNRRVDTPDLREELAMAHHPQGISYSLWVSDHRSYLRRRDFRRIGEVVFTASVASFSCDHRLHFAHPPYREDGAQGCGAGRAEGSGGAPPASARRLRRVT